MTKNAELIRRARKVLAEVRFQDYEFVVAQGHGGVSLRGVYDEPDVYDQGQPEQQVTRKWLLHPAMTTSEIVSTAFKCCLTSMEHRTREHFKYRGRRVYGPHFDVDDLWELCEGRENAGGRQFRGTITLDKRRS